MGCWSGCETATVKETAGESEDLRRGTAPMWHWDQGRLAYFQFDELRKIAKYVIENDFRDAEKDDLLAVTGLPFSAPATHSAWRNYSRILKIALLVREAQGRAEPTPVALALARPGEVTCDEYLHFLACAFTEPSPALQDWRPDAPFRYPLLFALKYLLIKTRMGVDSPSATLAEIVGAYGSSGFVGDEREDEFAGVALAASAHPSFVAGRDYRQERESLRVIAQLSYLHYEGQTLSVALTASDAANLFEQLMPVDGARARTRDAEIQRLARLFDSGDARPASDFGQRITLAIADTGFREGSKLTRAHVTIERNARLRREFFSARNTTVCDVCVMDTARSYPWTKGVLDLHHLLPLSSGTRVTAHGTRLEDLVPVCPSCHRAVHRYYDQWLQDHGRPDFLDMADAQAAYDSAKAEYPGFVPHV